jgi:hypothetical protein
MKLCTKILIRLLLTMPALAVLLFCLNFESRADDGRQILIAMQQSEYKSAIAETLTATLEKKQVQCEVNSLSALNRLKEDDWDAVIILHAVKMNRIKQSVKNYLKNVRDPEKVVLLTTTGSGEPWPGDLEIDTITSASKKEGVEEIAEEIMMRLPFLR